MLSFYKKNNDLTFWWNIMKKIMFMVSIAVSSLYIVLPMEEPRNGRIVNKKTLLSLRKTKSSPNFFFTQQQSKEKFQKEDANWKQRFEKLKVTPEDHERMIVYLDKQGTRGDSIDSLGLDAETKKWVIRLTTENPDAFTVYLYLEMKERNRKKLVLQKEVAPEVERIKL